MEFDWKNPFLLELKVAKIISDQAIHGCNFDRRKASFLVHTLNERIVNIDKELVPLLPKMMNKGSSYSRPFKLNGQFQKWPGEYAARVGLPREHVGGPFTAIWYTPFDPSKVDRVKAVMLDLGWVPTEWNEKKMPFNVWGYKRRLDKMTYPNFMRALPKDEREVYSQFVNSFLEKHFKNKSPNYMKAILIALGFNPNRRVPNFNQIKKRLLLKQFWPTSPKITEDSFDSLDADESYSLKMLRERMVYSHRRSLLIGLIEQIRPDGKLPGEANPCATPTARARHKVIVNIPAGGSTLGKECRSLFRGNKNIHSKASIIHHKVCEGMRVKPHTNILQEWNDKKKCWDDCGRYRTYLPAGFDGFVGGDGAGLELRMLTHYLIAIPKMLLENEKNPKKIAYYEAALESAYEYREVLLSGDIHSHNQRLAGLPTRSSAKTFIYAFL